MNCAMLTIAGVLLGFLAGVFAMGMVASAADRDRQHKLTPPGSPTEEDDQNGS